MASKTSSSFLAILLISNVLLALVGHAVGARDIPKNSDKKQPQWFLGPDGTVVIPGNGHVPMPPAHTYLPELHSENLDRKQPEWFLGAGGAAVIPGIGHVPLSPTHTHLPQFPHPGTRIIGGDSGDRPKRQYIPGNDDTFVPNPGYEVPIPGGPVPASAQP